MAKVEKLIKKFGIVFNDQNYYEAHQVTRTIYYRWLEVGEYEKLSQFLFERILDFSNVKETTIVVDLTDLYAKTISQSQLSLDDSRLDQIRQIFDQVAALVEPNNDSKKSENTLTPLTNALINWSTENEAASAIERLFGDARLNLIFAKAFEANHHLELAKKHYVCSKDPEGYAQFVLNNMDDLHHAHDEKDPLPVPEDDAFLSLIALQVLSIGRLGTATKLLHLLTEKYKKYAAKPPYASALLNFTWLLSFSVQLRSMEYFTDLIETYKPTLTRDPRILLYVDKIGQKFFGVPAKDENYSGGLLGNLLKGMMTKKKVNVENSLEFVPDDLEHLNEYKITDANYHSAVEAASSRNPPNSTLEPHFSDALDQQPSHSKQQQNVNKAKAQADMDLD